MRFVTFNICSGRAAHDRPIDLDRFAEVIAGLDPDVLSLQEVDRDQPRSDGADLTAVAAAAMGAEHRVFAPTLYGTPGGRWSAAGDRPRNGPAYGCALLSRVPMRTTTVHRMRAAPVAVPLWIPGSRPVVLREEPRVAIVADLELPGGSVMTVVGTHLAFVPGWNRRQLRHLVDTVRGRPDPLLLLGDLNLRGRTPETVTGYHPLADLLTFPAPRPRLQLDHALLRGPVSALGRVVAVSAPPVAVSDHRPLVVDVDLGGCTDAGSRRGRSR